MVTLALAGFGLLAPSSARAQIAKDEYLDATNPRFLCSPIGTF